MFQNYISQRLQVIRSYRHGIGKSGVICPAAFLASLGVAQLLLGINFYLKDTFNASASNISWVYTAWFLCYAIACILIRPLTDRFKPRHVILLATFLMCITTLLVPFCKSMISVVICAAFIGAASSMFWPPLMGWLSAGSEGKHLSRALSYFAFSFSIGGIIAQPVTGWLSALQPALPLYSAALLFLLTTALIAGAVLALPKVRNDIETTAKPADSPVQDTSTPLRFPAWIALFTTFTTAGIILCAFPVMARELPLQFSKKLIGNLLIWQPLCETATFLLMGWLILWHFKGRFIILNQLAFAAVMAGFAIAHSPLAIGFLLAVVGVLLGQAYAGSVFHGCSGSVSHPRRMAIHEMLLSVGFIVGAIAGGWIYEHFSMPAVYYSASALFCLAAVIQAPLCLISRRTHRAAAAE